MDDGVEVVQRLVVVEDDRRQRRPVELAVVAEDVRPEAVDDAIEHRAAGPLQLAHDLVGVDDDRAPFGEQATVDLPIRSRR